MDLIRRFDNESYARALESWAWLPELTGKTPAFTSAFGDVFLQAPDDAYWFLDALEGSLDRTWADGAELQAAINTQEGQDRFLMAGLAQSAGRAGLEPGPPQVLSFKVPPVLGGPIQVDNVEVTDFVVAINLAGQLHEQVKDLPPGARITGFEMTDE